MWFNKKDINISENDIIKLNDLHGYVLPHAGTAHTKQVINHTLRFKPTKTIKTIYIIYYPAYPEENIIINDKKKYYHEYYVILKILQHVVKNIWKLKNINYKGINIRDNEYNLDYKSNMLYVVSADFSHHKPFQKAIKLENCASHSILFRALDDNDKICTKEIDHINSFKLLYKILPENFMLQWIGRSRSSGNRGVGYLSFLIRKPVIRKANGFFVTAYDKDMRARECLGNVHDWNHELEEELKNDVIKKAETTSRLTGGNHLNVPIKYVTITYLIRETKENAKFIRGYHALMIGALYLPDVFLENTYENGIWISPYDKEWNHSNMENFDMKDTINKLNVKAGFKTSEIKLFKTKTIHLSLNNLNKHNDNTAMLNFSGNIIL